MARFRKLPVEIEAEQFWPDKEPWPDGVIRGNIFSTIGEQKPPEYMIKTLEGWLAVSPGDWIVTGIKGEKYPVKPDIFEKTYESVS